MMALTILNHRRAVLIGLLALFIPSVAAAQQDAMSFRVMAPPNCRGSCSAEIAADGIIVADSAEAFRAVAATLALNPIVVRLASSGGNLVGSLQLGQAFRALNATVIVGKDARCVSACVYAFLGGTTRRASGGRIGVHRFRPEGEDSDGDFPAVLVRRATEILGDYITQMGADPELLRLAMSIAPPAMHFLDAAELRRYRVTN
jgi:hypothetical protein